MKTIFKKDFWNVGALIGAFILIAFIFAGIYSATSNDCDTCPPLTRHYPIESAYRNNLVLTINMQDKDPGRTQMFIDTTVEPGKETTLLDNVYNVELKDGVQRYTFQHLGKTYLFLFKREMTQSVCVEYLLFKGEKIYVKRFGDDTK